MSKLMIFHNILPGCEEGNTEAWRGFLTNYTPTALELFGVYSPWTPDARLQAWRDALPVLSADACAVLKGFSHQSEREFLVGLRAFLQDWAFAKLQPSQDAAVPPAPTAETLGTLLAGLPLMHQEITFLALSGYSQATIEKILRITPAVAEEGLERLRASYVAVIERSEDRCLWPSAWIGISKAARANEQKDCTPLRQLIRILDGQASWYDKSPAETHRAKCLHCLELWNALQEVVAWDRTPQPLPADGIESLMALIPIKQEKRKPSLFARILGK
jgi:hypothetical protein